MKKIKLNGVFFFTQTTTMLTNEALSAAGFGINEEEVDEKGDIRTYILADSQLFIVSKWEEEKFLYEACSKKIGEDSIGDLICMFRSEVPVIFETPVEKKKKRRWAYNIAPADEKTLLKWAKDEAEILAKKNKK